VKLEDEVRFEGRLLNPIKREYVLLNKPKGLSTSGRTQQGKRTALGLVSKASRAELKPVGKLGKDASGLILYTNDGEMIKRLSRPKNGLRKIFH
ncbi:pseudouridine synthase, partial [Vibrio parahaemolyticus]|nr:pseudouridine synthase [Vibrio parahaemolyticus]